MSKYFLKETHYTLNKNIFNPRFKRKINSNCIIQNNYRNEFKNIIPSIMREVEDNFYGIDYIYKNISFDQKFSFGDLGENVIKIRTQKRRLLNKSDWTIVINKNKELEFFQTKKLEEYVKKNWCIVQKRTIDKKKKYNCNLIYLDEFYNSENFVPIKISIENEQFVQTLNDLTMQIIDYTNKICLLNFLL